MHSHGVVHRDLKPEVRLGQFFWNGMFRTYAVPEGRLLAGEIEGLFYLDENILTITF